MLLPIVAYYLIFHYGPMYGAIIAFKQFSPTAGISGSPWVGFQHFTDFFHSYYFWRLIRNTLMINVLDLVFGFPAPIIFALLLNEITKNYFKRTVQTITYMPHFISIVVVAGLIIDFCTTRGLFNAIIAALGMKPQQYLMNPKFFQPLYVASGIWQSIGWGSIIYLAALSEHRPAALRAGKGRWGRTAQAGNPYYAAGDDPDDRYAAHPPLRADDDGRI